MNITITDSDFGFRDYWDIDTHNSAVKIMLHVIVQSVTLHAQAPHICIVES